MYQVTLKQITEKIKTVEKENRELEENLSAWEQKANDTKKCMEETIRQKMLSEEALKFKEYMPTMERVNESLKGFIQSARAKLQAALEQTAPRPRSRVGAWEQNLPVNDDPEFHGLNEPA
nr:transport and Golgi organization protein 1 homolog [Vicugna pacos]